jgi:hypothetical protein
LHKFFDYAEPKHDLQQDFHLLIIHQAKGDLQEESHRLLLRKAIVIQDRLLLQVKYDE